MPDAGGHDSMDDVIAAYKADVDRSLLRENLRRTVTERPRNLMALQRFAAELRQAGRRAFGRGVAGGATR